MKTTKNAPEMGSSMATPLDEPLVLRTTGLKGYLKFPRRFVNLFDFDAKSIPEPQPMLEHRNGRVRLIYEWDEGDLATAGKQAEKNRATLRTSKA